MRAEVRKCGGLMAGKRTCYSCWWGGMDVGETGGERVEVGIQVGLLTDLLE